MCIIYNLFFKKMNIEKEENGKTLIKKGVSLEDL